VRHTLERGEAAVKDELEIAQVALGQGEGGELVGLGQELGVTRSVTDEEVLEDAAVGRVGHCEGGGAREGGGGVSRRG
jgi:hypothetical protein